MTRFDDTWYNDYRRHLLTATSHRETHHFREVAMIRQGTTHAPNRNESDSLDEVLKKLAPRHAGAVRGHMQFYRACLETIGIVPADAVMRSAVVIEWLWYSTPFKKFYRDHLAHVQKVTALADFLVADKSSPLVRDDQTALQWIGKEMADGTLGAAELRAAARRHGAVEVDHPDLQVRADFWSSALRTTLRIAGLLHDMAYPSVMAYKVQKMAEPNSPFPPIDSLHDVRFAEDLELLKSSLAFLPLRGMDSHDEKAVVAQLLNTSHSVQGALRVLKYTLEHDRQWRLSAFESFCVDWAAHAILLHDFDKAYDEALNSPPPAKDQSPKQRWYAELKKDPDRLNRLRPTFTTDPASYLLALADQLQDFGRLNYVTNSSEGVDRSVLEARFPFDAVSLSVNNRVASIDFSLSTIKPTTGTRVDDDLKAEQQYAGGLKEESLPGIFTGSAGKNSWMDHSGLFTSVEAKVLNLP